MNYELLKTGVKRSNLVLVTKSFKKNYLVKIWTLIMPKRHCHATEQAEINRKLLFQVNETNMKHLNNQIIIHLAI